jgi:hypothetical protein
LLAALALAGCAGRRPGGAGAPARLPWLRVSDNGRFLVTRDGRPFFWLGDTAWKLFQRTTRDSTDLQPGVGRYLARRAAQGFTVIQATLVWDVGPNAYGHEPFVDGDFARPRVAPGPGNDYWDYADYLVDEAERRGLYLAALPVWLNSVGDDYSLVRDPGAAYRYGQFLGRRYGHRSHIVWVLGGDAHDAGRGIDVPSRLRLTRDLAEGIADAVNGVDRHDGRADYATTLMTFHPRGGGHSSSDSLHAEPWLDFNMIQTTTSFRFANYESVRRDYAKVPVKPTLESEVAYEHSLSLNAREAQNGRRIVPWEVRRAAYWGVFAGGFGHTYGHRSFIQWTRRGENTGRGGDVPWYAVLDAPGARQMAHLRALLESRPFLSRVPDQSVVAEYAGEYAAVATRDSAGSYALVYLPAGAPVTVRLDKITAPNGSPARVRASWFDPRGGAYRAAGEMPASGTHRFTPPTQGADQDWVLVLDDARRGYPTPGRGAAPAATAP